MTAPTARRRIAWAGPWNARSAIAGFGSLVVDELAARGHDVAVYRTETGEMPGPAAAPGARPGLLARGRDPGSACPRL